MSDFIRFFISKEFWLSLVAMILLTVLLVWLSFAGLKAYTHHGESITVPDLRDLTIAEVKEHLKTKELRFQVIDSTYVKGKEPNTVIDQTPQPGDKVKESRRLYLTINCIQPPVVNMPDIIDLSLRNAQTQLEIKDLKLGEKTYKDDLAKNAVLEVLINGKVVEAGEKVKKGAIVDLVLGNGYGSTSVLVPDLTDMTMGEAQLTILASQLNVGKIIKDDDVGDVRYALVYKQFPEIGEEGENPKMTIGEPIDLYLKKNPNPNRIIPDEPVYEEEVFEEFPEEVGAPAPANVIPPPPPPANNNFIPPPPPPRENVVEEVPVVRPNLNNVPPPPPAAQPQPVAPPPPPPPPRPAEVEEPSIRVGNKIKEVLPEDEWDAAPPPPPAPKPQPVAPPPPPPPSKKELPAAKPVPPPKENAPEEGFERGTPLPPPSNEPVNPSPPPPPPPPPSEEEEIPVINPLKRPN